MDTIFKGLAEAKRKEENFKKRQVGLDTFILGEVSNMDGGCDYGWINDGGTLYNVDSILLNTERT